MKKFFTISVALLVCSTLAISAENFVTKKINEKYTEAKKNIDDAIKNDRIYDLFAKVGITNLDRRNKRPEFEYRVEPLYEVEAGVMFLPDSYKITLAYKTSINDGSTTGAAGTTTDSKAKTILFGADLLSSKKYGYLNFEYNDITIDGSIKNTASSNMYVIDIRDITNIAPTPLAAQYMTTIAPNEVAATEEKTKSIALAYRLPNIPYFGITAGAFSRNIPVAINNTFIPGYTLLSSNTEVDGLVYGIGFFNDFDKAGKNKLILKRVAYAVGTLDTKTTDINGGVVNGENDTTSYLVDLGYKFSKFELLLSARFSESEVGNFDNSTVTGFKQEELATTFSIGMRF